jgi:Domain of unknown function (DUF1707)
MNTTGTGFPPGALRVSDADRDRAITELTEHYQAGRITADEFDERSGQALRARTGTDLATLFDDLPPSEKAAPAPVPGPPDAPHAPGPAAPGQRVPALFAARIAVALVAAAVFISLVGAGHHGQNGLSGLFPILAVLLVVRLLVVGGRRRR